MLIKIIKKKIDPRSFNKFKKSPTKTVEISPEEAQKRVRETLAKLQGSGKKSSVKNRKEKREAHKAIQDQEIQDQVQSQKNIKVAEFATPNELASLMDVSVTDIITSCMSLGIMVSMNQRLDAETIEMLVEDFGLKVEFISSDLNFLVTKKTSHFKHLEPIVLSKQENIKIIVPGPDNSRRIALNEYFTTHNVNILKTLEMDGMIGTLELIASSDWCSVLPAVLCDLDLDGSIRTLSPLISPNFTTEYVLITSASKELNPISKLFSEKISKEIKIISSKMNNDLAT